MEEINYQIRPVRPSDLAAVTEVEAVCFPAAEAAPEESFQSRIEAFPDCFFVAEKEEQTPEEFAAAFAKEYHKWEKSSES